MFEPKSCSFSNFFQRKNSLRSTFTDLAIMWKAICYVIFGGFLIQFWFLFPICKIIFPSFLPFLSFFCTYSFALNLNSLSLHLSFVRPISQIVALNLKLYLNICLGPFSCILPVYFELYISRFSDYVN